VTSRNLDLQHRGQINQPVESVAVVGMGYVGLPLAVAFVESGMTVVGFDTDPDKVHTLQSGRSYIRHIDNAVVAGMNATGRFQPSVDVDALGGVDAVVICVPTPLTPHLTPDLTAVLTTARMVSSRLKPGMLVVLESTTYPETTERDVRPILEAGSGLVAGQDFSLAFSPEREDPGSSNRGVRSVPKVIGGLTTRCTEHAVELYKRIVNETVPVSSCRVAEATKILENVFRAVNIALVNELKVIYSAMGIDIWEVIDAAKTKPFGFMAFYPGPGLGGHCIPVDPFYLTWKAKEYGRPTRFIELAGEINAAMPRYVVERVGVALNEAGKPFLNARVLILGLAYKKNVDDDRESPAYELLHLLEGLGARCEYNDPFIPAIRPGRSHAPWAGRKSVAVTDDFDCIVLCTDHDDYKSIDFSSFKCPIVDTRRAISRPPAKYYRA
jgi:UDP-N-acetyl-D-glucosamine dehydrogenase